ncbi:hypothetical protein [Aestuariivirga sp.]|uniref:hypothetical protein n=1 Tax=Aestuariivirga sp. TaxID=2650926 RepID=UPI003593A18E
MAVTATNIYKVEALPGGKTLIGGVNVMIVGATSEANARVAAAAHFDNDSAWSDSSVTDLSASADGTVYLAAKSV